MNATAVSFFTPTIAATALAKPARPMLQAAHRRLATSSILKNSYGRMLIIYSVSRVSYQVILDARCQSCFLTTVYLKKASRRLQWSQRQSRSQSAPVSRSGPCVSQQRCKVSRTRRTQEYRRGSSVTALPIYMDQTAMAPEAAPASSVLSAARPETREGPSLQQRPHHSATGPFAKTVPQPARRVRRKVSSPLCQPKGRRPSDPVVEYRRPAAPKRPVDDERARHTSATTTPG